MVTFNSDRCGARRHTGSASDGERQDAVDVTGADPGELSVEGAAPTGK
jgi:hypothetical protein